MEKAAGGGREGGEKEKRKKRKRKKYCISYKIKLPCCIY